MPLVRRLEEGVCWRLCCASKAALVSLMRFSRLAALCCRSANLFCLAWSTGWIPCLCMQRQLSIEQPGCSVKFPVQL